MVFSVFQCVFLQIYYEYIIAGDVTKHFRIVIISR